MTAEVAAGATTNTTIALAAIFIGADASRLVSDRICHWDALKVEAKGT